MEGPTPVSALIHAATMVTAGVYLIARSTPLFVAGARGPAARSRSSAASRPCSPASIALTQNDLKRVLAYSTVSQLGYMFMALGAGVGDVAQLAVVAAMFHLFTHAFFKALLFLGVRQRDARDGRRDRHAAVRRPAAPAAVHLLDVRRRRRWPCRGSSRSPGSSARTRSCSPSSRPRTPRRSSGWGWVYGSIYWVAVLTAFMTAFYTGRAFFMTFCGPEKLPSPTTPRPRRAEPRLRPRRPRAARPRPGRATVTATAPRHRPRVAAVMTYPADGPGRLRRAGRAWSSARPHWFEHHLEQTLGFEAPGPRRQHGFDWATAVVGTLAGLLGLGLSYVLYAEPSPIPARLAGAARAALPGVAQQVLRRRDSTTGSWSGRPGSLASVCEFLDVYLVDGLVRGDRLAAPVLGRDVLAPYQNGLIQFYAAVSALGVAVLLWILLLI